MKHTNEGTILRLCTVVLLLALSVATCRTTTESIIEDQLPEGIELVKGNIETAAVEPPVTVPDEPPIVQIQPAFEPMIGVRFEPIVQVQSDGFSPNGDGYRDSIGLFCAIADVNALTGWELSIRSAGNETVFTVIGSTIVPESLVWNGSDADGNPVPEDSYTAHLAVSYTDGEVSSGRSAPFRLSRTGPRGTIAVPDILFSPDGDGRNDRISVGIELDDPEAILAYRIVLYDSRNSVFATYADSGAPPAAFEWDGRNERNELVEGADVYRLSVELLDALGNRSILNADIHTDVLVYREGDRYKIRISSITFVPFSANYTDVREEEYRVNAATLDRLAFILNRFRDYRIGIEGHAVQVYWFDPVKGAREQQDVLLPLSVARAQAILQALIDRGVAADRLTATGVGGSEPLVPHSDLQNRWKNRRVEFTLYR